MISVNDSTYYVTLTYYITLIKFKVKYQNKLSEMFEVNLLCQVTHCRN